ncbi:ribonuclease P protein component [Haloflavibacter putidus]|uniref:Ribonuclease P protein component n=2 Tax=Haloflavibacter putidus TaxID=2576776 RepID=A0A507ZWE5_9FLAO|nr:ribonuclease P protein component [Haloflavibacter putidus]
MKESFGKDEKLKSKILINKLFTEGKSIKKFPLKLIYIPLETSEKQTFKTGVSVPKRNFKLAVNRNRIKRLMREVFRKNKYIVYSLGQPYAFMFIYLGRKEENYQKLEQKMQALLTQFATDTKQARR